MTVWTIEFKMPGLSKYLQVEGYGDDHAERLLAQIKDAKGEVIEIQAKRKK